MNYSEDHIALAAEYALGTLDADERAQVETMMSVDQDFTAMVRAWEYRLGALNQMVGLVEPRPELWERIRTATGMADQQQPLVLPEAPGAAPPDVPPPELPPRIDDRAASIADATNVVRLQHQTRRWRGIASAMTAIAAALIAVIGIQVAQPDWLPPRLRPTPRTQIVEVKSPPAPGGLSGQFVALLQGQAGGPAFILTVDGATKNFTVRRVGTTSADPGKSFELWLISDKLPKPRSLGIIGGDEFTARPVLSGYASDVVNNATYAVTVEQAGGSPDGNPHSTPVFSGKLIETVPPAK
jgi:anti-sigma-K factor RskA